MDMIRRTMLAAMVIGWSAGTAPAQAPKPLEPDLARLGDGQSAHVFNRALTVRAEGARTEAHLDARTGDGGALLAGLLLSEGVIEVDLRGKDVAQQSFLGIAFHVVDWTTYDAVYFRPFNFRAADAERRSHSVQYISHPVNTWQKLRSERPGAFEQAIEPPPDPNAWFHARIVLANRRVEVYVNHAAKPSLAVEDLGEATSGGVALWAGNGSDGAFASLSITETAPAGPAPASRQTIFQAAGTGNLARLQVLVDADPNAVRARNASGLTPLHLAAAYGQRATAEHLVARGADVNAVARHSGTPLDLAYEAGDRAVTEWLASRGARYTPLRFDIATLAPAIHRVTFPWGMMNNVVVSVGADGAVLVDSGFSTRATEELKQVVGKFSKSGVRYLISSHNHSDHVAGNAIAPGPDAVITAATLNGPPPGLPLTRQSAPLEGRTGRTLPAPYVLRTGGTEIRLVPHPGLHSDTDLIVWFPKDRVVAMGDLLLSESVPAVTDIPGYLAFLANVLDVFPVDTTFVSGHGRDLTTAGLRTYRDTLNEMIGVIRTNHAAGRTVEQMVQDNVLKTYKDRFALLDFLPLDTLIGRVVGALQQGTLK